MGINDFLPYPSWKCSFPNVTTFCHLELEQDCTETWKTSRDFDFLIGSSEEMFFLSFPIIVSLSQTHSYVKGR